MESYEHNTCSFILKIWVEDSDYPTDAVLWRGHVTHVGSGKRQYFEDLSTALNFVLPYLKAMGIKIEKSGRPGITQ
ncbi:MAG: hypothetical protein U0350_11180 [Caldilineaceae bacterium]